MPKMGLEIKGDTGNKRIELRCEHLGGLLYVVPGEENWVCSDDLIHVHALSGFFGQLSQLNDPRITETMQRWGIYFRPSQSFSEKD